MNGRKYASLVLLRPKAKSSLHKFWYRGSLMHFTCLNGWTLLCFTGCRARWRTVGSKQVWFCLRQKRRSCYASSDTEGRDSMHFTCPKRLNSLSFLFKECHARGRMVGTRQVWFYVGQKRRVCYITSDTKGTQHFLLGLNGLTPFFYVLSCEVTISTN